MKNTFYDIYKITRMKDGVIITSKGVSYCHELLKDARKYCKSKNYVWPYYYILRRTKRGKIMYKP